MPPSGATSPGMGWLAWTGSHWRPDETGRILELCRRLCEEAAAGQSAVRIAGGSSATAPSGRSSASRGPIPASRRARRNGTPTRWLLNTPAGVVDLRTGEVLPSDPGLQMTRITRAVARRRLPALARLHRAHHRR